MPGAPEKLCPALLPRALTRRRTEAEALTHALPESFGFFRRRLPASLSYAMTEVAATGAVAAKSAEEDPA